MVTGWGLDAGLRLGDEIFKCCVVGILVLACFLFEGLVFQLLDGRCPDS
jgi:hypothetical protein